MAGLGTVARAIDAEVYQSGCLKRSHLQLHGGQKDIRRQCGWRGRHSRNCWAVTCSWIGRKRPRWKLWKSLMKTAWPWGYSMPSYKQVAHSSYTQPNTILLYYIFPADRTVAARVVLCLHQCCTTSLVFNYFCLFKAKRKRGGDSKCTTHELIPRTVSLQLHLLL